MNTDIHFHGARFCPLASGALFWPAQQALIVADLHLGKAARNCQGGGALLPPYETRETLDKLSADIARTRPRQVISLGDSFDSSTAAARLPEAEAARLEALCTAVDWVWITGNHDPAPSGFSGRVLPDLMAEGLLFRHIACDDGVPDVSGHYHPKARVPLRGRSFAQPCFLFDARHLILPAYGAYTGGLWTDSAALQALMGQGAEVILTGPHPLRLPMPRADHATRRLAGAQGR